MSKQTPFNSDAEQSVLGSILLNNNILVKVADELKPQDFYVDKNRIIFKTMQQLQQNNISIDYTTLLSELDSKNELEKAGGAAYLLNIVDSVFTTANIDDYIALIQSDALKRSIIEAATMIVEAGYNNQYTSNDYIDFAERVIRELTKRRKAESFTPISTVVENVEQIMIENRNRKEDITGITTGFKNLDELTLGLQNNNLIILAARPAMGKSAFAMNVAINAAKFNRDSEGNPLPVAVFSLEMSQEQIVQRVISADSRVHIADILSGKMSNRDLMFFADSNKQLKELNVYFSDTPGVTVADIRARCRKQKEENGLGLVIIDYLQLITGTNGKNSRQEEVSEISRSLKLMARELEVPVIALSQLSRKVEERPDKRPMMSDLRESGSIEQDADLIFFLYRASVYDLPGAIPGETELIVGKNRAGASGHSLKYLFKGENVLFSEIVSTDEE